MERYEVKFICKFNWVRKDFTMHNMCRYCIREEYLGNTSASIDRMLLSTIRTLQYVQ